MEFVWILILCKSAMSIICKANITLQITDFIFCEESCPVQTGVSDFVSSASFSLENNRGIEKELGSTLNAVVTQ